MLISKG